MLPNIESISVLSRIYQHMDAVENNGTESNSDSLIIDERAVASRATFVESKLAVLRQHAASYLRRSRGLEMN